MLTAFFQRYKTLLGNLTWRTLQVFARNGFSYAIFYMASLFLTKEDFGYYNYILKIAFFVILFVDFGISMAVSKFTAEYATEENMGKIKSLLSNGIIVILILGILASITTLVVNTYVFRGVYNNLIYLIPLYFFVPLSSLFDGVLRGTKQFRILSLITLLTGIISFFFFILLIKKFALTGAFYSQNIFYLLMLGGYWLYFRVIPAKPDKKIFVKLTQYAVVIGVTGVFMFLSTQVDVLFLGAFGYYAEIGYYEIIFKFLAFVVLPFTIAGHVISPDFTNRYMQKNFKWVRHKLKQSVVLSFIVATAITLLLYFSFPVIFETFFKKFNTHDLIRMSHIALILFFSNMLNGFIPLLAIATGHARWAMYFIIAVGVLNVFFDYISIVYWGVWGLIISTVILKSTANILFIGYYYLKLPKA